MPQVADHDRLFEMEWAQVEKPLTTMARKMFLPGFTTEDIVSEFKVESYRHVRWHDSSRSSLRTMFWKIAFNVRADLISRYTTQMRDHSKEAWQYTDTVTSQAPEEGAMDTYAIVPVDDFKAAIAAQIGNAGRFSLILNLESVDRIGKIVLFCMATGFNINETCYHVREAMGPNPDGLEFWFHRAEFNKVRRGLKANSELRAIVA